jgi:hypothetical protein
MPSRKRLEGGSFSPQDIGSVELEISGNEMHLCI